jgi:hypothetical protein
MYRHDVDGCRGLDVGMIRAKVFEALSRAGHGLTPNVLGTRADVLMPSDADNITSTALADELIAMEIDRQVILHRDSSAGQRMGGLPLPDGSSVTLVSLRERPDDESDERNYIETVWGAE